MGEMEGKRKKGTEDMHEREDTGDGLGGRNVVRVNVLTIFVAVIERPLGCHAVRLQSLRTSQLGLWQVSTPDLYLHNIICSSNTYLCMYIYIYMEERTIITALMYNKCIYKDDLY